MPRSAHWLFSILALLPIVASAAQAQEAAAPAKAVAARRRAANSEHWLFGSTAMTGGNSSQAR